MKTIDLLRDQLRMTDEGLARITADLRDKAMLQATTRGGNHPTWILGHLCFVEGAVRSMITGKPNPVEHWKPLFDMGSTPTTNAKDYPPFDELLHKFHALRAETLALLDEIGDAGLSKMPAVVPPGFEKEMKSIGHTFGILAIHQMCHYGQLADIRRAAGLKPLV